MPVNREDAQRAKANAKRAQPGSQQQQAKPNGAAPAALCLTPAAWAARAIPPSDRLLGDLFTTTTRTQLSADTGLGKTMLALGVNFAMHLGVDFLHWRAHRQSRVLIVDGEMPAELIRERLATAAAWFGAQVPISDGFYLLSREDVEDMPPLDTPEGARWIMDFITSLGHIDHVTFDNIAALTVASLKEEDGEPTLKELRRTLTKARIGQLWLHHTGHDATRGYGTKMREWFLDTVMVGERVDDKRSADVALALKFPKARRRTPNNRADFENVEIVLDQGQWTVSAQRGAPRKGRALGRNQQCVLDAAIKLLAASTKKPPPGHPAGVGPVVALDQVREETRRILVCDAKHFASRFADAFIALANAHRLEHYDGLVWFP